LLFLFILSIDIWEFIVIYIVMSTEKIEIKNKPKRPKKDNSKKGDIFQNCRCCGEYIRGDFRSNLDGRYCQDCL
tara:strand:- start:221 stop:442 length:222 start_codon:yes stop_codon:yes gene_type:complete